MEQSVNVALLWLLFGGSHIALATRRPRTWLVNRLGEWGFIGVFSLVAVITYAALIHYFAVHRFDGIAGPGLAAAPILRWALFALSALGAAVTTLSLFDYPASAYALTAKKRQYEPRPIERISRHGFFAGLALLAIAHALLASHLIGSVFFGMLAAFTWLGSIHQDRKLVAERGEVHRHYMQVTSFLPFVAILRGRQRLHPRELPMPALIAALLVPCLLRLAHDSIFAAGGAYVIAATVAGAAMASFQSWRRQRRLAVRRTAQAIA